MYINLYYFISLYMSFRIIAAMGRNFGIGHKGGMPWNVPADMKQFTKLTKGAGNNAVVMGRKTWQSIGCKPLRGRANIVMSSTPEHVSNPQGTAGIAKNVCDVTKICKEGNYDEVWIIGGGRVYEQFLSGALCDSCHLTHIDDEYPADVFFPMHLVRGRWMTESIITLSDTPNVEQHVLFHGDTLLLPSPSLGHRPR